MINLKKDIDIGHIKEKLDAVYSDRMNEWNVRYPVINRLDMILDFSLFNQLT